LHDSDYIGVPCATRLLPSLRPCFHAKGDAPNWKKAFRQESGKWGLFLTMIIFTTVPIDRAADYLVLPSFPLAAAEPALFHPLTRASLNSAERAEP